MHTVDPIVFCADDRAAERISVQLEMSGFGSPTVLSDVDALPRPAPTFVIVHGSLADPEDALALCREAGVATLSLGFQPADGTASLPWPCPVASLIDAASSLAPGAPETIVLPDATGHGDIYWELLDGASEIIVLIDATTHRILRANRRANDTYGFPKGSLRGRPYLDLVPPEQHVEVYRAYRNLWDLERIYVTNRFHVKANGERIRVTIGAKLIRTSMGPIIEAIIFEESDQFQRESELRRANLRLENLAARQTRAARHSEELLRLFVENLPDYAVFLLDPEGHVVTWNSGAHNINGFTSQEILGRHFSVFYTVEDLQDGKPSRLLAEARERGVAKDSSRRKRKDGSLFWAEVLIMPVSGPEGETWFAKITRDVSQRVETMSALRRSERMWQALAENVPEFVTILDCDGRIISSNRVLEGMKPTDIVGHYAWEYLTPASRREFQRRLAEVIETGQGAVFEVTGLGEQGMVHQYENNLGKVESGADDDVAAVLVARDVTERRRLERELAEQRTMSIRSDRLRSLGQMATGIAHELNQPLSGVRGLAEYLKACLEREWQLETDEALEKLNLIIGQADRMTHIIEHVRRFARGADDESAEPVDVNEVVHAVLIVAAEQLKARMIEIELDLASDLPAVMVNPFSLEEVLLNLLLNARDAIEELEDAPQEQRRVTIRTAASDGKVTAEVADRANGIPEPVMARVFEPFFTTKETDRGTGLGLAICKSIVETFDGEIDIQSTPGEGTTALVRFRASELPPVRGMLEVAE